MVYICQSFNPLRVTSFWFPLTVSHLESNKKPKEEMIQNLLIVNRTGKALSNANRREICEGSCTFNARPRQNYPQLVSYLPASGRNGERRRLTKFDKEELIKSAYIRWEGWTWCLKGSVTYHEFHVSCPRCFSPRQGYLQQNINIRRFLTSINSSIHHPKIQRQTEHSTSRHRQS